MSNLPDKHKLLQILKLLEFALSLEDQDFLYSTIESVIEMLQEEINSSR